MQFQYTSNTLPIHFQYVMLVFDREVPRPIPANNNVLIGFGYLDVIYWRKLRWLEGCEGAFGTPGSQILEEEAGKGLGLGMGM